MSAKKRIFIFGAGSGGGETLHLINDINEKSPTWEVLGYVDNSPELVGQKKDGYQIYRHQDLPVSKDYYGVCGLMDPKLRRKIVTEEIEPKGYKLPVLIHPTAIKSKDLIADPGSIVLPGVKISYEVKLGKCVFITINAVLGHHVKVGEYASIMTSAIINGNCSIGEGCFIGSGANLYQGVKIGKGSLVGIGTIITNDVPEKTSVVDYPRKVIRENK